MISCICRTVLAILAASLLSCIPHKEPDPEWLAQKERLEQDKILDNQRITKFVEILSSPAGARIEVNGEYVGESPCTVKVVTNGHGKLTEKFHVNAIPTQDGHFVQTNWFMYNDKAPARVFFEMRLTRSSRSIDVNITN
jgi:hypothetical protein